VITASPISAAAALVASSPLRDRIRTTSMI
jgi:hypothetical protein